MPKQKRWQLKRQLEQAENDLDRCQRNLIIVGADFSGVHDEYYNAIASIVEGLELFRSSVAKIKDAI